MADDNGLTIPTSLAQWLDPAHCALIVYDMQVGICSQVVGSDVVVGQVAALVAAARSARVRTFFTRHLSLPRELMGVTQYRTAMAWQKTDDPAKVQSWFLRDSPGFAIVPTLTPQPTEAVFDKITMSAFEGTPLTIALRDCDVRAVVVVGIALEIGIEPTVRHAVDLGFVPILALDACGHGDAEAADRTIAGLRFQGDAIISDVAAIAGNWT